MSVAAMPETVAMLLKRFVGINTVNAISSGDVLIENRMADVVEALAEEIGLTHQRLPVEGRADNLLLTYEVDATLPWILFESHMDTVAVEGMTIDPFAGDIQDNCLFGRGSCDTKGTGAAMLWALKDYMSSKTQRHNVALLFAIDEEYGMTGVRSFVDHNYASLGFTPVGAIVGEPTMLKPVIAHGGTVRWKITTQGVACHSSNPAKGRSAISDMMRVVDRIESQYTPSLNVSDPLVGKSQCSINIIRGGSQINIIPDECEIQLDRRVVPGDDPESVLPAVQKLLDELAAEHPDLKAAQELLFSCPPLPSADGTPLLKLVEQSLVANELPTKSMGAAYATDGGDMYKAGIPVIVIGPGSINQAHTKNEFLSLEQLDKGVRLYRGIMEAGV